jgi:hypothetical protein
MFFVIKLIYYSRDDWYGVRTVDNGSNYYIVFWNCSFYIISSFCYRGEFTSSKNLLF